MATSRPLDELIDRLAAFEPAPDPFVSLYLDTRPDQHGRARFHVFVDKELPARARTYPERSPERESLDRDVARIRDYLAAEVLPQANGIAIFACAAREEFFGAVQLEAPIEESELVVDRVPHLYPLARLSDQYRRHAAVVLDTNSARIFVFGLGRTVATHEVSSPKTKATEAGGWSQARYQRHVENFHLHHVKEVVDALDRVVRDEAIEQIVVAGDEVVVPKLRDQLPKHLAARLANVVRLDVRAPEDEVRAATDAAVREHGARDDAERTGRALDAFRAGGLGMVGVDETLAALANGQVHELLVTANPETLQAADGRRGAAVADELVARARQTDARVTFVEDPALLADVGGVAAVLRYRIPGRAAA